MLDFLRKLFAPGDPPPNIEPLREEGERQRERSARVVEELNRQHEESEAKQRRGSGIADTLIRARDMHPGQRS